jgi:tRNA 2-thiouridine synthesizing protein A
MADYNIDKKLDTCGLLCPIPVVKTAKAIKEMEVGGIMEMISTDKGSMPDMKAWANQTKHELLDAQEDGDKFRFIIKKTH